MYSKLEHVGSLILTFGCHSLYARRCCSMHFVQSGFACVGEESGSKFDDVDLTEKVRIRHMAFSPKRRNIYVTFPLLGLPVHGLVVDTQLPCFPSGMTATVDGFVID